MGRPSSYTDEIAAEICERIAEGESLRVICEDDHMPTSRTVRTWVVGEVEQVPASFPLNYERARQLQADVYFEEVVSIADGAEAAAQEAGSDAGKSAPEGKEASAYYRAYNEEIGARKLRIDSRKWVVARMNRAKYGDRTAIDHGNQPDNPLTASKESISAFHALSEGAREKIRKALHEEMAGDEG